ncbi:MAG: hypothetical protein CSA70_10270 [Rhodobacterales bacterium]|nr:MAG: hypothetical protein CSA70_10270 [Rhodobacterales bacterium]
MNRTFVFALGVICLVGTLIFPVTPSFAGDWKRLGYGRLTTNDLIGDYGDRWRTGSVASSHVFGRDWTGNLPVSMGEILEIRFNGEVISPVSLTRPTPGDRPYAGALSLGLHTHFQRQGVEFSMGADLVMTGPQTRLDDLQAAIHNVLNMSEPSPAVRAAQIPNGFHPSLVSEVGYVIPLGKQAQLRPFFEVRTGVENLVRAGADFSFGRVATRGELLVRDPVTGHRYRTVQNDKINGMTFVLGGDVARVYDSVYLPAPAYRPTDERVRLRAGVHWQGKSGRSGFYGLTWLGKEFSTQPKGQLVGSIRLKIAL